MLYLVSLTVAVMGARAEQLTPRVISFWDRVQACEEPTTGWRTHGSTYEGGVGFYVGTWAMWARELDLYRRYPHAWMAPRLVQIRVAEHGYREGGSWGCIHSGAAGSHP